MNDEEGIKTTVEKLEINRKSVKKLNIATAIVAVIALAGVGVSIYGITQNIEKENQIATLKKQLKNKTGNETALENNNSDADGGGGSRFDINRGEDVFLFHYVSQSDEAGNRYTFIVSKPEEDKAGFFNIIRSGTTDQESSSGYVTIDEDQITLSVGPFVTGNDFSSTINLAKRMGFTLESKPGDQENYRTYKTNFNENMVKLGNVSFIRVQ